MSRRYAPVEQVACDAIGLRNPAATELPLEDRSGAECFRKPVALTLACSRGDHGRSTGILLPCVARATPIRRRHRKKKLKSTPAEPRPLPERPQNRYGPHNRQMPKGFLKRPEKMNGKSPRTAVRGFMFGRSTAHLGWTDSVPSFTARPGHVPQASAPSQQ